jgi:hypothetical protein
LYRNVISCSRRKGLSFTAVISSENICTHYSYGEIACQANAGDFLSG